jgi:hypothetical protein
MAKLQWPVVMDKLSSSATISKLVLHQLTQSMHVTIRSYAIL